MEQAEHEIFAPTSFCEISDLSFIEVYGLCSVYSIFQMFKYQNHSAIVEFREYLGFALTSWMII